MVLMIQLVVQDTCLNCRNPVSILSGRVFSGSEAGACLAAGHVFSHFGNITSVSILFTMLFEMFSVRDEFIILRIFLGFCCLEESSRQHPV